MAIGERSSDARGKYSNGRAMCVSLFYLKLCVRWTLFAISTRLVSQVAIGYKQLPNKDIMEIPIHKLQRDGFLFIWVINARYAFALELFEKWGYE